MKDVKCSACCNLTNNWCDRVIDSPDPDMVRDCQYYAQKTNADRIRAMSDEELADFLGLWAARHHAWMCDGSGEVLHYLRENAK